MTIKELIGAMCAKKKQSKFERISILAQIGAELDNKEKEISADVFESMNADMRRLCLVAWLYMMTEVVQETP